MRSEATVVRPGAGLRVGNVEFLALNVHAPAGFDLRLRGGG